MSVQSARVAESVSQSDRVVLYDAYTCRWLSLCRPVTVLTAHFPADVQPLLEFVQTQVERRGLVAAGFVSYEAAPAFDAALQVNPCEDFPLAWFGLYAEVEAIALSPIASLPPLPHLDWHASISQMQYEQAIGKIKSYIQQGETYQVNFSFRLAALFEGDPWSYFVRMIHAQQCAYGGFIDTANWTICSSSPELFFQQVGSELVCRPMKGTAARGLTYSDDLRSANWLQASQKNRAENLMIVDMVRNDLARVARLGSVQVPQLFEVEQYPTLWQMTSSVRCETEARLPDLFRALFPPASITGAPKPRTMQIIADLERTPRRIYTGTIGFIMSQRSQFNVAIRTILIDKIKQEAEYSIGSGVIWDSQAENEFAECYTKARVLTEPTNFSLLETLLWTPDTGYFLLDLHLTRLQESAAYFAISVDLERVERKLQAIAQTFPSHAQKVRILLSQQGELTSQAAAYEAVRPLRVHLAKTPVDSADVFLYHKTTHRQVYARAKQACPDADDVLLWNERGELTESCIANLVVELEGSWYTPPVHCGLLAGTFRRWLLDQGKVQERVILVEDLSRCSKLFLVNSVYKQQVVCCL